MAVIISLMMAFSAWVFEFNSISIGCAFTAWLILVGQILIDYAKKKGGG